MDSSLLAKVYSNPTNASYLVTLACLASVLVVIIQRYLWTTRFRQFAAKNSCADVREVKQSDKPFGLWLIAQMVHVYRNRRYLEWWQAVVTENGFTFSFWILGKRLYVTADPENVKALFLSSFDVFQHGPTRNGAMKPMIGDGIFGADGETWSTARALLRPSFAKSQVNDLDMLERHFQNLLRVLPTGGELVDLQEMFKWLGQDVITDFLFGSSTESLMRSNDKEAEAFSHACEYSEKVAFRKLGFGYIGTLIPDLGDWRARRLVRRRTDQLVRQVLQRNPETEVKTPTGKKKRYVFLENLAQRTRDPNVLRDQLMSSLLGGRDTTSSLLSNMFYILARRPEIWQKLKAENDRIENRPPTTEDIQASKYARNCIQESLRLHPIVAINQRWASKDAVLPCGGSEEKPCIAIPRGSDVYISVWTMHRRTDIWGEDANEFRPERWDENLKPGWAFLPFGGGPRLCIGQEFAMTEAMFFFLRMLQEFDRIVPVDDKPFTENAGIVLNSAYGCKVYLARSLAN